jgi:hypothetical protein
VTSSGPSCSIRTPPASSSGHRSRCRASDRRSTRRWARRRPTCPGPADSRGWP